MNARVRLIALLFAALSTAAPVAYAQRTRAGDTLSPAGINDAQAELARLNDRTKANKTDTAAWHRSGLVAWKLLDRAKAANPPKGLDATRLARMADSSLRIAATLAPNDIIYQLSVGDFLIASGVPSARTAATKYYEAALAAARKDTNTALHTRAALEVGRVAWRRYDALANRRMNTNIGDIGRSLSSAMQPIAKGQAQMEELAARDREAETLQLLAKASGSGAKFVAGATPDQMMSALIASGLTEQSVRLGAPSSTRYSDPGISLGSVRNIIETQTFPLPANVTGGGDLLKADSLFNEAYKSDPTSAAAFRAVAMWLCEKKEWARLDTLARQHIAMNRAQGYGWLALGLALHRQGRTFEAAQVFDTSMMAFGPDEQRRLDSPSRTMPPSRAQRVDGAWSANRSTISQILWQSSDPMWTDGVTERRTEFRARVAYAELRWTVEEEGIKGANTDRGDIFIRYGPPDLIAVFGPAMMDYAQDVMTFWIYDSGLMFGFTSASGFGTARIPPDDRAMVDAHIESQPARWDNLGDPHPDSMVVRTTRFRGTPDSLEVFVEALPPTEAIRESAPSHAAKADVWLMAANARMAYHSTTVLQTAGVHAWAARVLPGNYLLRVEATGGEGAKRSARASGEIATATDFPMSGPGLSDLLIVASASEQRPGARWRDLSPVPTLGNVAKGSEVALVWENYEFTSRGGSSEYDVSVSIIPQKTTTGKIIAAITGALASVARIDTREDRTVIDYTRTAAAAPAVAETMSLSLAETPAGTYTITVDVTDKGNGLKFTRSTTLVIREK